MASLSDRLAHAWNAFQGRAPDYIRQPGESYNRRGTSRHLSGINTDRTIVNTIFNQIAIDVAAINIRHVRTGPNGRYEKDMATGLNECLRISANTDQTGRALMQDAVLSMFELGVIAIVPVDTSVDIRYRNAFDVNSLRIGKITEWYPKHVKTEVYNERTGKREAVLLPKNSVAIVENPFYEIMNKPNSTLNRLTKKLTLLDTVDEASSSGKLDLIIQLPYVVKTDERARQAEQRRKAIEDQLQNGQLGIAYTDGTERITQLNRPVENNLLDQIKYLTGELYNRLGLTEAIFNGTADENAINNYHNRTVRPILDALTESMNRTFLTKTARTQGQAIIYMQDPFKMVPTTGIVTASESLVRNEILTSNEIRQLLGYAPAADENADKLINSNINPQDPTAVAPVDPSASSDEPSPDEVDVEP